MQISTANLLASSSNTRALEKGEKLAKGNVNNLAVNLEKDLVPTTPNLQNLKSVITNLLMSLSQELKSKSAIFEMIQNSPIFKNMGNFSADFKDLITLLKNEPNMGKTLLLLENFQKNMEGLDAKVLKEQVQNSGIFFESKLANKASSETQLIAVKNLLVELKEHLVITNKSTLLAKELDSTLTSLSEKIQMTPKELHVELKNILDLFRQSVKQHLSFETTPTLKESYKLILKIEQALQDTPLVVSKMQNSTNPVQIEQTFTQQVKMFLTALKETFPQILAAESNSTPEIAEQIPSILDEMEIQLSRLVETKNFIPQSLAQEVDMTLQEQLKMVTNRIKQAIELVDPQSSKQVKYIEHALVLEQKIQTLIKPEAFNNMALMQKLSFAPTDMEILGDMKGVLTKLNDQLSTITTKSNETLDLVQKLTTQIEYHQLLSYVSSSNHLYIPLSWQGLKEGSMMMKQTQEESFHCQIDLDLEHYGKVNMMLILFQDKYIDLSIAPQKSELRGKVIDNLQELKCALNDAGLITGNVKLIEYKENSFIKQQYGSETMSNFGINIKI
ncbi:MAG: flagellar hook-length control protein FliK [Sulfurospirillaceae bacterium]|nr:flagellar hook-length control protein FliK [Sulfurospirillaceae bacterium]MDD2825371.1 flagellar hook-length control protein FliK [Sulfurospirillaceae bacterium]